MRKSSRLLSLLVLLYLPCRRSSFRSSSTAGFRSAQDPRHRRQTDDRHHPRQSHGRDKHLDDANMGARAIRHSSAQVFRMARVSIGREVEEAPVGHRARRLHPARARGAEGEEGRALRAEFIGERVPAAALAGQAAEVQVSRCIERCILARYIPPYSQSIPMAIREKRYRFSSGSGNRSAEFQREGRERTPIETGGGKGMPLQRYLSVA